MGRYVPAVLFLAFVAAACGSRQPMRFQFQLPHGEARIEIRDGTTHRGTQRTVYTLRSGRAGKDIRLNWQDRTIRGTMEVFEHAALTRGAIVPVILDEDLLAAGSQRMVTYVVYQRERDGEANPDLRPVKVYDHGDAVAREALIEEARKHGKVIAVLDFGG